MSAHFVFGRALDRDYRAEYDRLFAKFSVELAEEQPHLSHLARNELAHRTAMMAADGAVRGEAA